MRTVISRGIAVWNLARLAETLLPLLADDEEKAVAVAQEVLAAFSPRFEAAYFADCGANRSLTEQDADITLVNDR